MTETRLVRRDELLQGDKCGGVRGRQPNGCFLDEAIYAGLRPDDVLVYVKKCAEERSSQGRLRSNGEAAREDPRRKDAQIAHIKSGVRLPRNPPQFDKALMRRKTATYHHCTTVAH